MLTYLIIFMVAGALCIFYLKQYEKLYSMRAIKSLYFKHILSYKKLLQNELGNRKVSNFGIKVGSHSNIINIFDQKIKNNIHTVVRLIQFI